MNKFRVWYKRKMFYPGSAPFFIDTHGKLVLYRNNTFIPLKDAFVSWSSGFRDTNNVEIYQGDILLVSPYVDESYIVTVRYEDAGFIIDCYQWDNEADITLLGWYIGNFGSHTIKVIGNIYEKPWMGSLKVIENIYDGKEET